MLRMSEKIIGIGIVLVLLVGLPLMTACGKDKEKETTPTPSPTKTVETPSPSPSPTATAVTGPSWVHNVTYQDEKTVWTTTVTGEEPADGVDCYVNETSFDVNPFR